MKALLPLLALVAIFLTGCAETQTQKKTASRKAASFHVGQQVTVRTTAYTHSEPGGRKNGCDGRLRFGGSVYSAAADWSWMPLGTRFRMCSNNRVYVIEDYGSALVGRQTIDLYVPSRREMNRWGVRHEQIEILEWGSPVMSLKLLEGRQRNAHVRQMVAVLRQSNPPKRS